MGMGNLSESHLGCHPLEPLFIDEDPLLPTDVYIYILKERTLSDW